LDLPILEYIQSMDDPRAQATAMVRLTGFEIQAARQSTPNEGALEIVAWLKAQSLALGIITRNSRASVTCALENFHPLGTADFDLIITREDPLPPKPNGDGVVWAARRFGISPREVMVVGDYLYDCQAGRAAGAVTALLDPAGDPRLRRADCDYRIGHLAEIKALLEQLGCG
jgi:phosphoglycolate phosphatase-like HAD superfamily hydrolase